MRLHIGLPGPFSVSVGGRRRRGQGPSVGLVVLCLLVAFFIGLVIRYPWVAAAIVLIVLAVLVKNRRHLKPDPVPEPNVIPKHLMPTRESVLEQYVAEGNQEAAAELAEWRNEHRPLVEVDPASPGPKLWVPGKFLD